MCSASGRVARSLIQVSTATLLNRKRRNRQRETGTKGASARQRPRLPSGINRNA
jgi:hypothetical protein